MVELMARPRSVWESPLDPARIRVLDVLDLLAAGLSVNDVLGEMPALKPGGGEACWRFVVGGLCD